MIQNWRYTFAGEGAFFASGRSISVPIYPILSGMTSHFLVRSLHSNKR